MSLLVQALFAAGVLYFIWIIAKPFFIPHPLDNVQGPKPDSFAAGNSAKMMSFDGWPWHLENLRKWGSVFKIHMVFGAKALYVADPVALYSILLKDHESFDETDLFLDVNTIAFGHCLMGAKGDLHRRQRKILNPVFSVVHMRNMIPVFYEVADELRDAMAARLSTGPQEVDVLGYISRTALELFGRAGLGTSLTSLDTETSDPFVSAVKAFFPTLTTLGLPLLLTPLLVRIGSDSFRRKVVENLPWKTGQQMREIIDTIQSTGARLVAERKEKVGLALSKRAGEKGSDGAEGEASDSDVDLDGRDVLTMLLKANMQNKDGDRLTDDEVRGVMCGLLFAAIDTTSSGLARVLHVLAEHPAAQERLRAEIISARLSGNLDYDDLSTLPFLDAVCRETLRLYAPAPYIWRTALKDTVLPVSKPLRGVDGTPVTAITVPKGTEVVIGIMATNVNEDVWGADANVWRPERWLGELPESVRNAGVPGVYSHLMTFLGGNRSCIGFKFSQLEMKVVISLLIETFTFAPPEKQRVKWRLGQGIQTPSVEGAPDGAPPELPLKLGLVAPASF